MEAEEGQEGHERIGGETKRARFVRLAQRRTEAVMDRLRVLGNCSNRSVYEYTEADVQKIFDELARELEETRRKFERTKGRREFRL